MCLAPVALGEVGQPPTPPPGPPATGWPAVAVAGPSGPGAAQPPGYGPHPGAAPAHGLVAPTSRYASVEAYVPPPAPGHPAPAGPPPAPGHPAPAGYAPAGYAPPGHPAPAGYAPAGYAPAGYAPPGHPAPAGYAPANPADAAPTGWAPDAAYGTAWPPGRHPGWPAPYPAPSPPGGRRPEPARPSAPGSHAAGWTTFAAIAVGALLQYVLRQLTENQTIENEAAIRYSIVTAVAVYVVVSYLVISRIQTDGHPLRWLGSWPPVASAGFGLAVGGSFAWVLLSITRAAGAEGGDSGIALLVSEGDFAHVAVAFLIVCVAAPIVEELLFRGLLMASLMHRGTLAALAVSSVAFAAWHLDPTALRYYSVAGALLGFLYLKQGLACSIAAHFAFNGTLLAAAVAYAIAPGPVITHGDLTLEAPDGWHAVDDAPFGYLHGPSGGEVMVILVGGVYDLEPAELVARVQLGTMPELSGFEVRTDTARTVELPAGEAVRVKVGHDGRDGDLVMLPSGDDLYVVVLSSGGSARVRDDFVEMLDSVRVA